MLFKAICGAAVAMCVTTIDEPGQFICQLRRAFPRMDKAHRKPMGRMARNHGLVMPKLIDADGNRRIDLCLHPRFDEEPARRDVASDSSELFAVLQEKLARQP